MSAVVGTSVWERLADDTADRPPGREEEHRTMRRALITGITGQDGSYLAELLLEKGYDVYTDTSLVPGFAPVWLIHELCRKGMEIDRILFAASYL